MHRRTEGAAKKDIKKKKKKNGELTSTAYFDSSISIQESLWSNLITDTKSDRNSFTAKLEAVHVSHYNQRATK